MRRAIALVLIMAGCLLATWQVLSPRMAAQRTARAQAELIHQIPAGRGAQARVPLPTAEPVGRGEALAELRIPRFGQGWRWVAVEGTGAAELELGPGHYEGTPLPGQRGNVGFAAHRAGHGDPFLDFDLLRPGDTVVFTQGTVEWTYRLDTEPRIVMPDDTWVLDPTPGRRLTLTTCWPRYGSEKRMFVSGALVKVRTRSAAPAHGGHAPWHASWTAPSGHRVAA